MDIVKQVPPTTRAGEARSFPSRRARGKDALTVGQAPGGGAPLRPATGAAVGLNHRDRGAEDLQPAFLDPESGAVYISRYADGAPAPLHILEGLPHELVSRINGDGPGRGGNVIAGFVHGECFHSRTEASRLHERGGASPQRITKRLVFL